MLPIWGMDPVKKGTALAAWLATGLDVELLRRCFGGFLLVVGLRELFAKT